MSRRRDLIAGARSGRLRSGDVIEPTITVTNLGDRGADVVFGVIYPPQVALVGFGAIAERPSVHEGEMVVHPTVVATLSGDHRASDGPNGARLLIAIEQHLQHVGQLL